MAKNFTFFAGVLFFYFFVTIKHLQIVNFIVLFSFWYVLLIKYRICLIKTHFYWFFTKNTHLLTLKLATLFQFFFFFILWFSSIKLSYATFIRCTRILGLYVSTNEMRLFLLFSRKLSNSYKLLLFLLWLHFLFSPQISLSLSLFLCLKIAMNFPYKNATLFWLLYWGNFNGLVLVNVCIQISAVFSKYK